MKKNERNPLVLLFLSALLNSSSAADLDQYARSRQNDLRISVYATAGDVQNYLASPEGLREAISLLRAHGVTRLFLEFYRGGVIPDSAVLAEARDHFLAHDIDVAGGIATVPGRGFGVRQQGRLTWFNWEASETRDSLSVVMRYGAALFDTLIVDDFLCTADTSRLSVRAKGERSWSEYRRDLLSRFARDHLIAPARQVDPEIEIIIKYPQWYDRFHLFGYDVARQSGQFDAVWVGTETRGAHTPRYGFVQPYEAYVNYSWIRSVSDKVAGAWFDHGDCDGLDFIDQAYPVSYTHLTLPTN